MPAATENYFSTYDGLRLFYRDYAAAHSADTAGVVLCLPGLTRNSRDFIALASHLQSDYRVLALDLRGRGLSEYDKHWQNYQPGTYVLDVFALLRELKIERVAIVGTSLGALMAMLISAQQPELVAGMVLNDAGPETDPRGRARIAQYAGKQPIVRNWDDAAQYIKSIYGEALWGLSDADWHTYAKLSYRENEDGIPVPDCDPNIGAAFRETYSPAQTEPPQNLWPVFAQIKDIPALVIRGEHSDILSVATVQRMAHEKPDLQYIAVPNRGHAPMLNEPICVTAIDRFLGELKF
jgi:pimeloyl-ACP methyl ester carboxylesterase